jgi:hypothetical protein
MTMHRRSFLTTVGGAVLSGGILATGRSTADGDAEDDDSDTWCVSEARPEDAGDGAPLTPTDDPDFVVDGSTVKSVNVYWQPEATFSDLGFPSAGRRST